MKSNDVRMQINRDLHAQFKRVDGDTNNERMAKLLSDSKLKYKLIDDNRDLKSRNNTERGRTGHWLSAYHSQAKLIRRLTSALVVSIAASVCSVAYVCVTNGWFL
ncbi:TMhelix containing protein [Vibrio phage 2.095.A._10N.286.46.E10]|nr:TMhelix containing protein [Vibrio phage 2.095.A._10N.286.46.E10]AUS02169.1 TMhelix containing protein [Vibrio phage 2.095.B._10N.286.46.E10]